MVIYPGTLFRGFHARGLPLAFLPLPTPTTDVRRPDIRTCDPKRQVAGARATPYGKHAAPSPPSASPSPPLPHPSPPSPPHRPHRHAPSPPPLFHIANRQSGMPPTRPHAISSTSQPFPTGGQWDHPPLRGRPRRPTPATTAKETKLPNPPPSGKRGSRHGFSLWGA